jgi:hypothetical protein
MSTAPQHAADVSQAECIGPIVPSKRPDVNEAIRCFEAAAGELGINRPSTTELARLCEEVAVVTEELFPGGMQIVVRNDPDIPDDLYFVFNVGAEGDLANIAARNDEWHGRVCRMPVAFCGVFRLSIAVR